jgi:hypothetical protein
MAAIMQSRSPRACAVWLIALGLLAVAGCASDSYRFGRFRPADAGPAPEVQVAYGRPNKTLDRLGRIVGWPSRILPFNKKVNNHEIGPDTLDKLKIYLVENDLSDVYVCINRYNPKEQWRLLRANRRIGAGWRYSVGLLSLASYTLLPSRIFGGDEYNPYTNTLELCSDVPVVVLQEAAYAKDVHDRRLPGTYAALNELPLISLWHEIRNASDVLTYARMENDWPLERDTYHTLYPLVGAQTFSVGAIRATAWWQGPALSAGGALCGHAVGRTIAARRAPDEDDVSETVEPPPLDEPKEILPVSYEFERLPPP